MFDKLFSAFAGVAKSLSEKELNEKDIDDILFDLEMSLLESDVASEVIDSIKSDLKRDLIGTKVEKSAISETVRSSLIASISSLFDAAGSVDLHDLVRRKKEAGSPFLVLFVGINGTGKTTSLAKVAYMLQQAKYSVVVAASDTFRAGAIEQLKEHTKRLNLKLVAQNYNSDPAAVARDAVLYAKAHRTDCVLIDTAGRMQTSKNLMEQIAKITNVVKPDLKIFVGDSLAGNDTVNQAREFFEHTKFDAAILTKADADARGGAALSIAKVTSTPIIYVGVGQEYPDLKPFDKKTFLEIVFGKYDDLTPQTPVTQGAEKNPAGVVDNGRTGEKTAGMPPAEIKKEAAAGASPKPSTTPRHHPAQSAPSAASAKPGPDSQGGSAADGKDLQESLPPDDPFSGIDDSDIAQYSDLFDVPPPQSDSDARDMASKIQRWISDNRPDPDTRGNGIRDLAPADDPGPKKDDAYDKKPATHIPDKRTNSPATGDGPSSSGGDDDDDVTDSPDSSEQEVKNAKPKKKRGMFGFLKRGGD